MATIVATTRSGRVVKKPVLYEPDELCDDDYSDEDSDDDVDTSDCESESDDDEDESGNLKNFVVDDSEDDEDT